MAKLSDLREDSWSVICARIRNDEHPREDDLAAALRRGEVVPPEAQAYLADLLEGRIDRRGQRRNKRRKWSEIQLMMLQIADGRACTQLHAGNEERPVQLQ